MLKAVLERHEPGYERDPTKKIQLLNHLASVKDDRVPPLVAPYLADMDEGVRYAAVEALVRHKNEEAAREPLLQHSSPTARRACASGCRSPKASPSTAGWSKATAARSRRSFPSSSSWTARATSRRKPDAATTRDLIMPKRTDIKTVMLIGSGPIVIGQACEFDYSGTQASRRCGKRATASCW